MRSSIPLFISFVLVFATAGAAQTDAPAFQAGAHVALADLGEFNTRDVGLGGRVSWHPSRLLGVEGELTVLGDPFSDAPQFSAGRTEGFFGATVGPTLGRVRPFAKLRPGFLTYRAAGEPIVCILIFPPPLSCTLAEGRTLFALDVGGGVEVYPSAGTFIRADIGDRIVRYPSPVIDTSGEVRDSSFSGHELRFTLGGGVRF